MSELPKYQQQCKVDRLNLEAMLAAAESKVSRLEEHTNADVLSLSNDLNTARFDCVNQVAALKLSDRALIDAQQQVATL